MSDLKLRDYIDWADAERPALAGYLRELVDARAELARLRANNLEQLLARVPEGYELQVVNNHTTGHVWKARWSYRPGDPIYDHHGPERLAAIRAATEKLLSAGEPRQTCSTCRHYGDSSGYAGVGVCAVAEELGTASARTPEASCPDNYEPIETADTEEPPSSGGES